MGVIRFAGAAADRRGQSLKPGVYTMRYSDHPSDGAHQGVAPQRDFVLLTPIANDPDPNAMPDFATLVSWSTKASGTPHPAVLSIETPAGSTFPAVTKEGDHDTVLNVKIGDLPIGHHRGRQVRRLRFGEPGRASQSMPHLHPETQSAP